MVFVWGDKRVCVPPPPSASRSRMHPPMMPASTSPGLTASSPHPGIRQECEECDGAPDFLLLHSLGGGSGSGLGSRLMEGLREEYPLNHIATVSVAPRAAGDSPMQSLNSVMALSFLQAYADVVMMFSNQDILDALSKGQAHRSG